MQMLRRALMLSCLLLLVIIPARAQDDFYLKDGDRVVFYGDSITAQRLYTTFAETFAVTRFPHRNITFVHSGWGGDRVGGGGGGNIDVRLDRDVIAYKPTVMTVMLGMNDGAYRPFDQAIFDTYAKGYQHIVAKMKQAVPGIRMTLIQPSPYDDVAHAPKVEGGYNAVLVRYGQFVKELAEKEKLDLADLNTAVVTALAAAKDANAAMAAQIIPDQVHPGPGGHLLMAAELLKAWHAPGTVTSVEIDGAGGKLVRAENTQLTDLKTGANLAWTQTDGSLPMPVNMGDIATALSVRSSDFVTSLDWQPLKVTGLPAARYELKIDGASVGTFTTEQLAMGVNLALLPTPMAKQAAKVHDLTVAHNNIHDARWHSIQLGMAPYKLPATQKATADLLAALDAEETETVKQQRAAAQPVPRQYELIAK